MREGDDDEDENDNQKSPDLCLVFNKNLISPHPRHVDVRTYGQVLPHPLLRMRPFIIFPFPLLFFLSLHLVFFVSAAAAAGRNLITFLHECFVNQSK